MGHLGAASSLAEHLVQRVERVTNRRRAHRRSVSVAVVRAPVGDGGPIEEAGTIAGIGVSEEVVMKCFNVFWRVRRQSATATGSTVSTLNRLPGTKSSNSVDFVARCSCTEPMTSPAIRRQLDALQLEACRFVRHAFVLNGPLVAGGQTADDKRNPGVAAQVLGLPRRLERVEDELESVGYRNADHRRLWGACGRHRGFYGQSEPTHEFEQPLWVHLSRQRYMAPLDVSWFSCGGLIIAPRPAATATLCRRGGRVTVRR